MSFYEDGAAVMERGYVVSVAEDGARVASLTRVGIVTMPLKVQGGGTVSVGDVVFFFEFEDGDGMICAEDGGAIGPGTPGATPELVIGTVVYGDEPSATITGTPEKPILHLVLPRGLQGIKGDKGDKRG
jgi:hypothetical protein